MRARGLSAVSSMAMHDNREAGKPTLADPDREAGNPALPAGTEDDRESSSLSALFVSGIVFGIPFLLCAQGAVRGSLSLGSHFLFAGSALWSSFAAWALTAALGALWLGVSLHLGLARSLPERIRNALGFGLILAGASVLFVAARLAH